MTIFCASGFYELARLHQVHVHVHVHVHVAVRSLLLLHDTSVVFIIYGRLFSLVITNFKTRRT